MHLGSQKTGLIHFQLTGKEKKKANKTAARPQGGAVDADDLRAALAKVRTEELPATPEEKEQYFMTQVGMAEELAAQGMLFYDSHLDMTEPVI